jgi:flagellar export protein FliJ
MGFQFSLSSVLRVREMIQEREEGILKKILFEISHASESIGRIDTQLAEAYASRQADVLKPSIGLDFHASYGVVKDLKRRREELQANIRKLEQARDAQLAIYEAARRNRETLSDLREKKHRAYEAELNKREQKAMDDNFIARRHRS